MKIGQGPQKGKKEKGIVQPLIFRGKLAVSFPGRVRVLLSENFQSPGCFEDKTFLES